MRKALFIAVGCLVAAAASCNSRKKTLPPLDRFYFPSGIHHHRAGPTGEGFLYVVSANTDRRYDTGVMTAVDLDTVGLPEFGADDAGSTPVQILDLNIDVDASVVQLANFGADLGVAPISGGVRMFIPSRAEGQKLMVVDAHGTRLDCVPTIIVEDGGSRVGTDPRDCGEVGASLVELERIGNGVPRADSPMMATVSPDAGTVWVSSGRHADAPRFSMMNYNDYIVRLPLWRSEGVKLTIGDFQGIGPGSTHAVAVGQRWAYFSGRFPGNGIVNPPLLRLVDEQSARVVDPFLQAQVTVSDARGIALSSDERRLFLVGRQPSGATGNDFLVIASITGALTDNPIISPLDPVPLPTEPQMVKTIARPGRRDLVVIVCSGAGSLALYDDESGIVKNVDGIGVQPSSFAIDRRGAGARIYVTNFQDGRVAVVDIPDLLSPQDARIVAHLGATQVCITRRDFQCDAGLP